MTVTFCQPPDSPPGPDRGSSGHEAGGRRAAERGSETSEGIELDANLTQTDLAGMVGASRQSVNQILQGFARRGYLQVRGRRIVIHRLDLLRRRAGLGPVSGG